ncbi:hypothetical protein Pelo_13382 [Pelomyxa schiedti]|nr:hypothetical protein Pelo_13382 [Pelomyxa schiedti]
MRAQQEAGGFRRTGCTVGASSASGYGHSASDGTAFMAKGDGRNASMTPTTTSKTIKPHTTTTTSSHHEDSHHDTHHDSHHDSHESHHESHHDDKPKKDKSKKDDITITIPNPITKIKKATKSVEKKMHKDKKDKPAKSGTSAGGFCATCGNGMEPGARFCPSCGSERCKACNTPLPTKVAFCPSCGGKI